MKSPIERNQETSKQKLPLRGEGNQPVNSTESVDTVITNSILENIDTEDMLPRYDKEKGEIIDGFGTIYDIVETDIGKLEIGKTYQSNESPHISFVKRINQSETTYKNLNLDSVGEIRRHD